MNYHQLSIYHQSVQLLVDNLQLNWQLQHYVQLQCYNFQWLHHGLYNIQIEYYDFLLW